MVVLSLRRWRRRIRRALGGTHPDPGAEPAIGGNSTAGINIMIDPAGKALAGFWYRSTELVAEVRDA
jgi:hypothetical protein